MDERDPRAVLSADTTRDAEDIQVERWRTMLVDEKADLITTMCQMVDAMAVTGIRLRHPDISDHECFLRLAVLKLGADLARRVHPAINDRGSITGT